MESWVGDAVARQRFSALLVGVFAVIALLLAAIGIYGVVAYAVGLRTREFGIRMALGAERADVLCLVFRHGAVLAALGIVLGVAGALAMTQLISGLLFGVSPHDPTTIAGVAAVIACIALLASWIPARRATRVDPILALRYE
jgi:ABC-type antimicrobial peptide transport system permease subunit